MIRMSIAALTVALLVKAVAAQQAPEAEQAPELVLADAWVRALPPTQPATAGYLTAVNEGGEALAVVGGSSPVAGRVELHTTREVDGLMRMERLPGLALAAGESVELAPGGAHLMLLELKYMPRPGDEIDLCLELADGRQSCTVAEVRASGGDHATHNH